MVLYGGLCVVLLWYEGNLMISVDIFIDHLGRSFRKREKYEDGYRVLENGGSQTHIRALA